MADVVPEWTLADVEVTTDVIVVRRDGAALSADVYRPANSDGALPTLVMRLPYDKRRAQTYWYAAPSWYAQHGFAVVVEDVRGRHASAGVFEPFSTELADGVDLLRWIRTQPWSNGRIGLYGYSYAGLLQLLLAGSGDDAPDAIVPAMAMPRLGEGALFRSGVPAIGFALGWAAELDALAIDPQALRSLVLESAESHRRSLVDGAQSWAGHWIEPDPAHPYWARGSDVPDYASITAAVLNVGGWYDIFREGSLEHFAQLANAGRARVNELVIGPWTHQPLLAAPSHPMLEPDPVAWSIDQLQLQFFRRELMDIDPGPTAAVRVTLLNSDQTWEGPRWPPEGGSRMQLFLTSAGRANGRWGDGELALQPGRSSAVDHLVYDHAQPVDAIGGDDCGDPQVVGMGPADQEPVERRPDVLVYSSEQLGALRVLGRVTAELWVQSAGALSQWLVRLCIVTADGRSTNVAEAATRVRTTPNEPALIVLELGSVALQVGPQDRLRIHVTNGSSPRWSGLRGEDAVQRSVVIHDDRHPSSLNFTRH